MIFKQLMRNRLRSLLTILGIAASVSVYIGMASVTDSFHRQLDKSFIATKLDIIVHASRSGSPLESRISPSDAATVAQISGIASSTPVILGSLQNRKVPYILLFAVKDLNSETSVSSWLAQGLLAGRMAKAGKGEVMLGHLAAQKHKLWVGDPFFIDDHTSATITGIYAVGLNNIDGALLMDTADADPILGRGEFYNLLMVRVLPNVDKDQLIQAVNRVNPRLAAFPANRFRDKFAEYIIVDTFAKVVGAASFGLSCLLILNAMLMAVSERRREIALLSAIGWSRWRITSLVTGEALVLAALGASLGYIIAATALPMVASLPQMASGWFTTLPSPILLPKALAICMAAGSIGALYPALVATAKSPIEALRQE